MNLKTHHISGAGNTFHVFYGVNESNLTQTLTLQKMRTITIEVCKKVPADGFIFLVNSDTPEADNEYKWFFFNNDGSDAEMCGNATRCVGYYVKNIINSAFDQWLLSTVAGKVKIELIDKENYKIKMTPVREFKSNFGFYCDTGVPHVVIEKIKIIADENLKLAARELRQHAEFSPRGTNVTYVTFTADRAKIKAVSYERGVEDFTAACGTGALAAAFYNLTKRGVKQTQVEMPGGTLMMDLSDLSRPEMSGPAVLLGSYEHEISI